MILGDNFFISSAIYDLTALEIKNPNNQGVSIVLVEQNAELALDLARHGYVLETGNVALEGEVKNLMDNDHVRKAYLGI